MTEGLDIANMTSSQRDDLMSKVKQEMVMANAQEVLQRLSDKCVKRCIKNPGTSLDKTEQTCLANCMDRFMDAWNVVSRAYQQRLLQAGGGK